MPTVQGQVPKIYPRLPDVEVPKIYPKLPGVDSVANTPRPSGKQAGPTPTSAPNGSADVGRSHRPAGFGDLINETRRAHSGRSGRASAPTQPVFPVASGKQSVPPGYQFAVPGHAGMAQMSQAPQRNTLSDLYQQSSGRNVEQPAKQASPESHSQKELQEAEQAANQSAISDEQHFNAMMGQYLDSEMAIAKDQIERSNSMVADGAALLEKTREVLSQASAA